MCYHWQTRHIFQTILIVEASKWRRLKRLSWAYFNGLTSWQKWDTIGGHTLMCWKGHQEYVWYITLLINCLIKLAQSSCLLSIYHNKYNVRKYNSKSKLQREMSTLIRNTTFYRSVKTSPVSILIFPSCPCGTDGPQQVPTQTQWFTFSRNHLYSLLISGSMHRREQAAEPKTCKLSVNNLTACSE